MIVEILVPQSDRGDSLSDQRSLVVGYEYGVTWVRDRFVEGVEQTDFLVHLAEQKGSGVCRDPTPAEIGDDRLRPKAGKRKGIAVTVCHRGGLASERGWLWLTHTLYGVRSPRYSKFQLAYEISGLTHEFRKNPGLVR